MSGERPIEERGVRRFLHQEPSTLGDLVEIEEALKSDEVVGAEREQLQAVYEEQMAPVRDAARVMAQSLSATVAPVLGQLQERLQQALMPNLAANDRLTGVNERLQETLRPKLAAYNQLGERLRAAVTSNLPAYERIAEQLKGPSLQDAFAGIEVSKINPLRIPSLAPPGTEDAEDVAQDEEPNVLGQLLEVFGRLDEANQRQADTLAALLVAQEQSGKAEDRRFRLSTWQWLIALLVSVAVAFLVGAVFGA